ncbi:uvrABC system protein C [Clostridium sp. CAG:524]|nr:uvrABC system protein C [Clostridium sp. CAG:524]
MAIKFTKELREVPKKSGCYLMYNSDNVVIYVGKAKILFNRLKSYFTGRVTGKTKKLVSEIDHFEYIVTNSETEAFILEINLIKKYDPKYNILLRDDKSYPYIELTSDKYPRLIVKREININKKSSHLFGPYPNVYAARRLVNLLNRLYPLKKCDTMPKKVCLYYHIGECLGYCEHKDIDITPMKNEILSILNGNDTLLINKINEKIKINSDNLNYEVCKELVEELGYIKEVFKNQSIVELDDNINRDVINYYYENSYLSIVIFFIRNGKLVGNNYKIIPIINDIKDTLEYYISTFYSKSNIAPKEIIMPEIIDIEMMSNVLNTKVITVKRGPKKKLFDMAYNNAKEQYDKEIRLIYNNEKLTTDANEELRNLLHLDKLHIIEAFDNSNLFGTFSVSGMVSFIDGVPSKKNYRKFKLTFDKNDDVASMKEVIYRRYFRVLKDKLVIPDLIIVDGGNNQINACKEILESLNLNIKVIGVKKDDHHSPESIVDGDTYEMIKIDKSSNVFRLLSRIDEEVHRFTINYHKEIRSKGSISSVLDNINGLGDKRKKMLIKKYGSVTKMKEATTYELSEIIPLKVAEELHEYLESMDK